MATLNMQPEISCIVCTYNRQDFILRCLEALSYQSLDSRRYEIVAVDNRSKDDTPKLIQNFIKAHPALQMAYVYEEKQGLSYARNRGAKVAQGDFLTYIDDDAVADPRCLEEILRVFTTCPVAGCVGGRIDLALPRDIPWWYFDAFVGYFSGFDLRRTTITRISEVWQLPYGTNFSVRKKILEEIDGFSVHLGRKGNDFSGGEEIDLAYRIAAHGWDLYYNPLAIVTHHVKKDRMTVNHMIRTSRSSAKVWVYMERELMNSNTGLQWDFRNLMKDCIKCLFYFGDGVWKQKFRFFLQALHNYEKVKTKLLS